MHFGKHQQCCAVVANFGWSLQGGDLRHALTNCSNGELKWHNKGATIALDIVRGLHFLHSHGVSGRISAAFLCICQAAIYLMQEISDIESHRSSCGRPNHPGVNQIRLLLLMRLAAFAAEIVRELMRCCQLPR